MFSLRMKLNDVIGKDEEVILENIRRCKLFSGKQFKVIFRNDGLSSKECEKFVKRNEKMLFEINTQITSTNSPFDNCWFLINTDDTDKCKSRYKFKGEILQGIAEYIKMVKLLREKENEEDRSR
tara:strand:- start:626 stop:997 length:372 start_codon:yes stop_codon:yes gene_type:complete